MHAPGDEGIMAIKRNAIEYRLLIHHKTIRHYINHNNRSSCESGIQPERVFLSTFNDPIGVSLSKQDTLLTCSPN